MAPVPTIMIGPNAEQTRRIRYFSFKKYVDKLFKNQVDMNKMYRVE